MKPGMIPHLHPKHRHPINGRSSRLGEELRCRLLSNRQKTEQEEEQEEDDDDDALMGR